MKFFFIIFFGKFLQNIPDGFKNITKCWEEFMDIEDLTFLGRKGGCVIFLSYAND